MSAEQIKRLADDALNKTAIQSPLAIEAVAALHAAIDAALPGVQAGEFVVTCTPSGECVMVSRQDEEGRILSVIWERNEPQLGGLLEQLRTLRNQPMFKISPNDTAVKRYAADLDRWIAALAHTAEPLINAAPARQFDLRPDREIVAEQARKREPEQWAERAAPNEPVAPLPSADPNSQPWAVALTWSSADPKKEVLWLAVGGEQIARTQAHHSFIRWVDPAERASPQAVPAEPTPEMIEHGRLALIRCRSNSAINERETAVHVFRSMTDAAPQAVDAPVAPALRDALAELWKFRAALDHMSDGGHICPGWDYHHTKRVLDAVRTALSQEPLVESQGPETSDEETEFGRAIGEYARACWHHDQAGMREGYMKLRALSQERPNEGGADV
jgi:hypothetical protein